MKCPSCGNTMSLRRAAAAAGAGGAGAARLYVGCAGYPACRHALWLPPLVKDATLTEDTCPQCGPDFKLVELSWSNNSVQHLYPAGHRACLGGCDPRLLAVLGARPPRPVAPARARPAVNNTATRPAAPPAAPACARPAVNNTVARPAAPPAPPAPPAAGDNAVECGCRRPALLLTVRKQNANCGKKFYKCAVGKDNGGCDFFLWAPEGAAEAGAGGGAEADSGRGSWSDVSSQGAGAARGWGALGGGAAPARGGGGRGGGGGDDVRCDCGEPCKRLTVQKEGANRGRQFLGCARDYSRRCQFFQWADDAPPAAGAGAEWGDSGYSGGGGGGSRGRARGGRGRGGGDAGAGGRRCGLCRQPGHTRARCPQAAND
ncbi:unnamed protein product [Plutella xylostella]|uniref:(diamondback moth) hypothetical protein n=1 Tax=Plutella xylostella TaxID=51655 RepID=A0A8S4GEM6_PLUXY|nr:unnamed protein product [Plutella xylostella]